MGDTSVGTHKPPAEPWGRTIDTAMQTMRSDSAAKLHRCGKNAAGIQSKNRIGRLWRETSSLDAEVAEVHKTVQESTPACMSVNVTDGTPPNDRVSNDGQSSANTEVDDDLNVSAPTSTPTVPVQAKRALSTSKLTTTKTTRAFKRESSKRSKRPTTSPSKRTPKKL